MTIYLQTKAIKLSTFTQYIAHFFGFSILNLKNEHLPKSASRATVSVVFESLPYQELRVSCPAQSHLSLLCIPCVKVQVWWDLPEDGHQLLSHMPPMQTL